MAEEKKSYMSLCLHVDGGHNLYFRIPTVWDEVKKKWLAFFKTPKTQKLIYADGTDSFDLEKSITVALSRAIEENGELGDEIFSLFQPMSYWDEMGDACCKR